MVGKIIFIEGFGLLEAEADTSNLDMLEEFKEIETLEQYNAYQKKWFGGKNLLIPRSICSFKILNSDRIRIAYNNTLNILKNF